MHPKHRILVFAGAALAVLAAVTSSAAGTTSAPSIASKVVYTAGSSFQSDVYVLSSKGGKATDRGALLMGFTRRPHRDRSQ